MADSMTLRDCTPRQGIEINQYAAELARTTIWIGDIQWKRRNGLRGQGGAGAASAGCD
jgi:hypothetical protein